MTVHVGDVVVAEVRSIGRSRVISPISPDAARLCPVRGRETDGHDLSRVFVARAAGYAAVISQSLAQNPDTTLSYARTVRIEP